MQVMDEICHIAEREQVDMVIVAGDLFDAFHPSVEAIELLYKTLKKVGCGRNKTGCCYCRKS
jgi:exonuclease SbcD